MTHAHYPPIDQAGCRRPVPRSLTRPIFAGALASAALLAIYLIVLSLVSGVDFMISQLTQSWSFVGPLALGFGIQVGLYVHLRDVALHVHHAGNVVAASGTTSTLAMISCCAHYLTNVLPILGVTGLVAMIAEYQIELFWVGLAFNAAGIAYVSSKVYAARRAMGMHG
jgi:Cu+-exporting ATPase